MIEEPLLEPVPEVLEPEHKKEVMREPYILNHKLVDVVKLAITLGRPLLLQGDPGCGKTRLAYAAACALGLPIEECYIKSTTHAQDLLYTYDAVNRLYDAQLGDKGPKDDNDKPICQDICNYIHLGPLGRSFVRAAYGRRSVVLIDEIDKADLDFPNDLLLELDRLEFRVAEAPSMFYNVPKDHPELRPIVFVTHNEEKALPTAFLRRCIFHYLEFPENEEKLLKILSVHKISDESLIQKAIKVLIKLRKLDLTKKPGLSELIDWVGYLEAVKTPIDKLDSLPHIGVLLKMQIDQQRAFKEMH